MNTHTTSQIKQLLQGVSTLTLIALFTLLTTTASAQDQPARVQIIHNAADPAAAAVDIYVNGTLTLDDFAFRSATPYLDLPSNTELAIGVAPGNSAGAGDVLATFNVTLMPDETYSVIANGVLDPAGFAANPDGRDTGFTLFVKAGAREASTDANEVQFFAGHAATDAPTVDVVARGIATLVDDAAYGDLTDYVGVPAGSYTLDVTPGDTNTIVASFSADISGLAGGAAVVLASGFLNPAANQNGAAFGIIAVLPDGTVIELPAAEMPSEPGTARVQIVHNAADPAAATVDIYVNDALALDDFAFRAATPFLDLPAGVTLSVGVAPGNSTSSADALATFDLVLEDGETYAVIANGVLDPMAFAANPDGRSTGFNLWIKQGVRESIRSGGLLGYIVAHGVSDAPAVDVRLRELMGRAELASDAAYGDITDHSTIPTNAYTVDIAVAGSKTVVASYEADLRGLGGATAILLASGFLDPAANQDGAGFAILAVLADGTVVQLPQEGSTETTARVQIIHNAADPNAGLVDVYVNGARALDDFAFRSATPYIDLPAGVPLQIDVAPFTSASVDASLATFSATFEPGGTYVVIANGVLEPGSFAPNPDGRSTGFTLFVKEDAREASTDPNEVQFFAGHAATDAPTVDVIARDIATLVDDAAYGDLTGYAGVPAGVYTLDVTPGSDNNTIVASFTADLSTLAGGAAVVLASGFLDPSSNQDRNPFGLIAVLPDGTVVELPAADTPGEPAPARVQIIHNAADPAAAAVDIYVNGALTLDDFAFRAATPYLDLPGNVEIEVAVAPGTSTGVGDALATFPVTFAAGGTFVVIANGVLDPSAFAANPDGRDTGFTLFVKEDAREASTDANEVQFFAGHAASDAPTVDIIARDVATLVDDAAYGDLTGYLGVPAGAYTLDVTPGSDNSTIVASFAADLSGLAGGAAVVLASGFLDPASNQNGPAFGIIAVLPDGTVVAFDATSGATSREVEEEESMTVLGNYPNPFNPTTNIRFDLPNQAEVSVEIFDMLGRNVMTIPAREMAAGNAQSIRVDGSTLASGTYLYRISARMDGAVQIQTGRMLLLK